jgi:ribokinase
MAAVGHVEWVQFARVEHVAAPGEVVHATDPFAEPAGGGAVAAVQLARLAGGASLLTALGADEHGERSRNRLEELGVSVSAQTVERPTRRALTLLDAAGERTITTLGPRLQPTGADAVAALGVLGAVYFTAGDLDALTAARAAAGVLVANPRAGECLEHGVELDALVYSAEDQIEREAAARVQGRCGLTVRTAGVRGGEYESAGGGRGSWEAAQPPGPHVDAYGCGDSFAAGLAFALASGRDVEAAIALAARCGAVCSTGRGPYGRQLTAQDLAP